MIKNIRSILLCAIFVVGRAEAQTLDDEILELRSRIKKVEEAEVCSIVYQRKCFWIRPMGPSTTSFLEALALCFRHGGKLADIESQELYNHLVGLTLPIAGAEEGHSLSLWTGMLLNPHNGDLLLTNVSRGPDLKWANGFPKTGSQYLSYTNVLLKLNIKVADQGLKNEPHEVDRYGAICQKNLAQLDPN